MQNQTQPPKKKKKDSPIGLIIIICIFVLMLANFPIGFVRYDAGSTKLLRIVTPVYTLIMPDPTTLKDMNGSTQIPETEFYFFPNNFKSYEELREIAPKS